MSFLRQTAVSFRYASHPRAWQSLVVALILSFITAACAPPAAVQPTAVPAKPTSPPAKPIVIGVIAGLTADSAVLGVGFVAGAKMAADEINAKGGINGRQVKLVIEDNQTNPQRGVEAAQKLVNVDKVDILICSCFTTVFFPITEAIKDKNIVILSNASSTPFLRKQPGNIVSMIPTDDVLGVQLARMAIDMGYKNAALMSGTNDYAQALREVLTAEYPKLGGKIVADIVVQDNQPDYRPEVKRLCDSKPEAILGSTFTTDAQLQFRQQTDMGCMVPWFKLYPKTTKYETLPESSGRVFGIESGWPSAKNKDWLERYTKLSGDQSPTTLTGPAGYDNVMMAALAVANAADTAPASIMKAVREAATKYEGPTGTFEFDNGTVMVRINTTFVRLAVKDGKWIELPVK